MNVRTKTTFFLGDLKPATSSLSVRYFSTSFINVSALLLSPWKVGGSLPIALTLVAAATGWFVVPPVAAGPPPPGGPSPLGGPGGVPPVPPPRSPIAVFRSLSSSASVRGCCGAIAEVVAVCVMVWVVVIVVPVILCEKSLLAMLKNGVWVSATVLGREQRGVSFLVRFLLQARRRLGSPFSKGFLFRLL